MKNKEKFRKEIIDIALGTGTIAVIKETGKPKACKETICPECIFYCMRNKECSALAKEWAENEYTEPPIDWNKVLKIRRFWLKRLSQRSGVKDIMPMKCKDLM